MRTVSSPKTLHRRLTRHGIELHCLTYNSAALAALRRDLRDGTVEVCICVDDLSHVLVRDPASSSYIRVPSMTPDYTDRLTLAEHYAAIAYAKAGTRAWCRVTVEDLRKAMLALRRAIEAVSERGSETQN